MVMDDYIAFVLHQLQRRVSRSLTVIPVVDVI